MNISEAIAQYESASFKYGTLDCCLFVANVIRDVSGIDYAAPWRGRYRTEIGALRMVKECQNLEGIATSAFGRLRPVWTARAGFPVMLSPSLVEHDSIAEGLGIYDGKDLVYMTEKGLARTSILNGTGCFHV